MQLSCGTAETRRLVVRRPAWRVRDDMSFSRTFLDEDAAEIRGADTRKKTERREAGEVSFMVAVEVEL